jgi:hypothetical protein
MAKIMMMFSIIVIVGLVLVLINDGLESLFQRYKLIPKTPEQKLPELQFSKDLDFSQKIVRIDFNHINRSREQGNQLGEHVTVLQKAA